MAADLEAPGWSAALMAAGFSPFERNAVGGGGSWHNACKTGTTRMRVRMDRNANITRTQLHLTGRPMGHPRVGQYVGRPMHPAAGD